ncbi:hypothetical protein EV361DRAFT_800326, partial [Lentinula raphanica]
MPPDVETKLEKRIRRFLWDEKTHVRVNKETILAPIKEGGHQVLDIIARNEAITVTWIQSYLNLTNTRAEWAYVADALIAHHVPASDATLDDQSKINIFLQSWRTNRNHLPKDLQNMIKVAQKHNLSLEGIAFSRETIRAMPIWLHRESAPLRKLHNGKECRCLRMNHGVKSVGDAEHLAKVTLHQNHKRRTNCRCAECKKAREEHQCPAPFRCMSKAMELIRSLPPKWNPFSTLPEDYEPASLPNPESRNSSNFDWKITTSTSLTDAFRIFTDGETHTDLPNRVWNYDYSEDNTLVAYTDGSCSNDADGAKAGAGIHFPNEHNHDRAIRVPESLKQTNQTGEIVAIKEAIEGADNTAAL